ncbi:MAG: FeoB-associated Cys-rich membrane protein [Clostridiales bacterium]|nr:FeoB-associated Cys-rich membrane protein [Clostridiales bacterium]
MNPIDVLIIIGCVAIVVGVIVTSIINKKKGKTSCGCDCAHCSGCANKTKTEEQTNK